MRFLAITCETLWPLMGDRIRFCASVAKKLRESVSRFLSQRVMSIEYPSYLHRQTSLSLRRNPQLFTHQIMTEIISFGTLEERGWTNHHSINRGTIRRGYLCHCYWMK